MRVFYENSVLLHPIRALKIALRRRVIAWDAVNATKGEGPAHPALLQFEVGELLPWKGVTFKVGKVAGGDFPAIVLVPAAPTHGAKLRLMRNFRDSARFKMRRERDVRAALGSEASR